jgi:signal transduction histidine kinase
VQGLVKAVGHRLARMLVAEPAPLALARRHGADASAMSQPFAFALLLGMAPIVAVVARRSLGLLPILALPVAAVWLAGHGALRAQRERARAEAAAEQARSVAAEQARLVQGEQALIRRLQESERLKQDLLAVVSHELKTPLTVILGTLCTLATREAALARPSARSSSAWPSATAPGSRS